VCALSAPAAAEESETRLLFRVPAQRLDEALLMLAQQADVQLAASGNLDQARHSGEVSGVMSLRTALSRLLNGTGYTFSLMPDGVVTILRADASPGAKPAAPVVPVSPPSTQNLAHVVVSARRRDELWIDVPMAVSVLDGRDLAAQGIENVAASLALVPGVTAIDAGAAFTQIQIRGVSSSLGGNDNGYYLDDLPFTGVTVPWHPDTRIFDVERLEILKGPQGTLFGEGSMGGTVRILTRAPEMDRMRATLQTGLVSTQSGGSGGSVRAMGNLPLVRDTLAMRAVVTREVLPGWVDAADGTRDINEQRVRTERVRLRWSPDDRWLTDLNVVHAQTDAPGGDYAADDTLASSLRLANSTAWNSASLSTQRVLPHSRLTLLGSRAVLDTRIAGDLTPTTTLSDDIRIESRNLELRWASLGGGNLDWQAGISRRDAIRRDWIAINDTVFDETVRNRADAVFGDATLHPQAARWSIGAGLRYFREDAQARTLGSTGPDDSAIRASSDRWIPRVSLGWHLPASGLLYASTSTGFRSGLAQPISSRVYARAAGIVVADHLEPDRLISHEVGFKQLLQDGRWRLQGALFRSRWHGLPVRVPIDDANNALANSDGARIHGAELELRFQPDERLDLSAGATFVDARYSADVIDTPIRRGTPVYNVPQVSLAGAARYSWPIGRQIASVAATVKHHSRRRTGLLGRMDGGDPITALDMRVGVESIRWGMSLYIDNVTNEDGAIDGRSSFVQATRLRPRSLGLEVQYSY